MNNDATNGPVPEITLGWRLRIALERADIKADDMAKELGVHRGTITRWTHDIGREPRPIYLQRWADICGVPYAWLLAGVPTIHAGATDNSPGQMRDTRQYVVAA
jgi:transcriptional regulator with XRE-family HTH domain